MPPFSSAVPAKHTPRDTSTPVQLSRFMICNCISPPTLNGVHAALHSHACLTIQQSQTSVQQLAETYKGSQETHTPLQGSRLQQRGQNAA
jgi:hypothetical protein